MTDPQSSEPSKPDESPDPSGDLSPQLFHQIPQEHLATALRRFRFESRRAIDGGGDTMVELLEPGSLVAASAPGEVVLSSNGAEVGRIPLHRLEPIDPQSAAALVLGYLASHGTPIAAAMAERLHAGEFAIFDTAEGDFAWLSFLHDDTAEPASFLVFRPEVIPSWPEDDYPERIAPDV